MILLYEYDAWGNCTITSGADDPIVVANPFRYRGYYYDTETGLYYCNTRYYDPQTGRFISADSANYLDPSSMNGMNLYAYCINNPVMYSDPTGHAPKWWQWLVFGIETGVGIALCFVPGAQAIGLTLIGMGVGSIINGYITENNGGTFTAGWVGGQVAGLLSYIPVLGNSLGALVGSIVTDGIDLGWSNIDIEKALWSGVLAYGVSIFPGIVGEVMSQYKIKDVATYFVVAYNSIYTSIANSIINVYWRGDNAQKTN